MPSEQVTPTAHKPNKNPKEAVTDVRDFFRQMNELKDRKPNE